MQLLVLLLLQEIVVEVISVYKDQLQQLQQEVQMLIDVLLVTIVQLELPCRFLVILEAIVLQLV